MKNILTILATVLIASSAAGQLLTEPEYTENITGSIWDASWVKVPGTEGNDFGVYLFRNTFTVSSIDDQMIIHISADNRYRLYVNGKFAGFGPVQSDAENWNFDTYNLSDLLTPGRNILAIEIWNYGEYRPLSQQSVISGLIVRGDNQKTEGLNTPGDWKCVENHAYEPGTNSRHIFPQPGNVFPRLSIDGNKYPWGWMVSEFDDSSWTGPECIYNGSPKGIGENILHALVPRTLPSIAIKEPESPQIISLDNKKLKKGQPGTNQKINANENALFVFDMGKIVSAYPEFRFTGGKNSRVEIRYSTRLLEQDGHVNFMDIQEMAGGPDMDIIYLDGGNNRKYSPLDIRSFRYVEVKIQAAETPLVFDYISASSVSYPFSERAVFISDNAMLSSNWKRAWNNELNCSQDIFFKDAVSDQVQYAGPARLHALNTMLVSGDNRLMRKSIDDFYHSITPEGITSSRYPSVVQQINPSYSLEWISMLNDYFWYQKDYLFVAKYLVNIQQILRWYENHIDKSTGMLGPLEYWPYIDDVDAWMKQEGSPGLPPGCHTGGSSVLSLQYAVALDQASDIFSFYGLEGLAKNYSNTADALVDATKKLCWDETRNLMADTPEKNSFSMHANILSVLSHAVPKTERALFFENVLRNTSLIPVSSGFTFELSEAIAGAELGDKYLQYTSQFTQEELNNSLIYEYLTIIAGIKPASPGFSTVIIKPAPNGLEKIEASLPWREGDISIDLNFRKNGSVSGTVTLPVGLSGIFVWDNQTVVLKSGKQSISLGSIDSKFKLN